MNQARTTPQQGRDTESPAVAEGRAAPDVAGLAGAATARTSAGAMTQGRAFALGNAYGNGFAQAQAMGGGSPRGSGTGRSAGGLAWGSAYAAMGLGEGTESDSASCMPASGGQSAAAPGGGDGAEAGADSGGERDGAQAAGPGGGATNADMRDSGAEEAESGAPDIPGGGVAVGRSWDAGECSQEGARQQAAENALGITVANEYPDPATGGLWNRTNVGIGEKVTFDCLEQGGTWVASSGTGRTDRYGLYQWQAGDTPGSATITYNLGNRRGQVEMTVVAPAGMLGAKATDIGYGSRVQGAGMRLNLTFLPLDVSFAHVQWLEVPGPGIVDGYFERFPASAFDHHPTRRWIGMGSDNQGAGDTAAFSRWGRPWSAGTWTWSIPNKYRVAGSGGGTEFFTSTQVMSIADETGASTVTKFEGSTSRTP